MFLPDKSTNRFWCFMADDLGILWYLEMVRPAFPSGVSYRATRLPRVDRVGTDQIVKGLDIPNKAGKHHKYRKQRGYRLYNYMDLT